MYAMSPQSRDKRTYPNECCPMSTNRPTGFLRCLRYLLSPATLYPGAPGLRLKRGATTTDELRERFPKLTLQAAQLPTGEWIVASPTKPLTEDEAEKVVMAYQTIQELVARGLGR